MEQAPGQVGQPFTQALLIHIQLLASLIGDGLGHGDGFQQTQQGNRQTAAGQTGCAPLSPYGINHPPDAAPTTDHSDDVMTMSASPAAAPVAQLKLGYIEEYVTFRLM